MFVHRQFRPRRRQIRPPRWRQDRRSRRSDDSQFPFKPSQSWRTITCHDSRLPVELLDDGNQALSDGRLCVFDVAAHPRFDALFAQLVPELLRKPLTEVARSKLVQSRYKPLGKKHERFVERVRQKSELLGRVVFVDLTESVLETVGKFVTYALFPKSVYSVTVGLLKNGPKISVGYNPWSGQPLDADISAICARYGGGGHPVVGAISFTRLELEKARTIARAIADELSG